MASKPNLLIKLAGIILIIGGFVCIFVAWRKYNTIKDIIQTSEKYVGMVIGFDEFTHENNTKTEFAPVFQYEVNNEQKQIHSYQYSFTKDFETNEVVTFYISRNEPSKVFIYSFGERWAFVLTSSGAGSAFLILGVVMLFGKFEKGTRR